ncbi:hypothetical protein TRFO_08376 [Tritrichomonas foetus]|uniref:Wntless-like transmembrane domain-containing protein n=1 Tax=Tritrichomonas foetus TaxID=1144522 RepID=A0A1J4JLZ6_9EUKA|nr:hypothetical protein TRFO_08376 [Tritrichomonas foetus]|eukprot:OHS99447.1 hypothetical protein TRFO_08376 [Tritrichomonas foetus]
MTDEQVGSKLEPLGLTSETDGSVSRRIEAMTRRQIFSTVFIYGVCSIVILVCLVFGPPYYISQSMFFQPNQTSTSSTRRYKFEFTGLHFFNDFLTCELKLNKSGVVLAGNRFNLSVYFMSTMTLGSRTVEEINQPIQHLTVTIPEGSDISNPIRIFSTGIVKFDQLKGFATLKFPQHMVMGGEFIWSFADPAHSMVQLFLRLVFFLISIIIFIRLILSDFDFHHSHIAMRLMFILDIFLIIGSDPLYVLTYFSSSYIIKLYDCVVSFLLLVSVGFTAFSVLLMTGLKHRDITFRWILVRFIPFLFAFVIFAAGSGYAVILTDRDPMSKINNVTKALDTSRMVLIAIYALCLGYGCYVFQSDVPNEKSAFVIMAILFFCVTVTSELMNALEPFLGSDFAIQLFSLFSCAVYILFFNFLNWPVDSSIVMRNEVDEDDGDNNVIEEALNANVVEI